MTSNTIFSRISDPANFSGISDPAILATCTAILISIDHFTVASSTAILVSIDHFTVAG